MARKTAAHRPKERVPGRGAEIMAFRNRARRPDIRSRAGRSATRRKAIEESAS